MERNPVRAGLVPNAADYPWSSAQAHCGNGVDSLLSKEFPPPGVVSDWAQWLGTEDDLDVARIRSSTRTGRPCGAKTFLAQLENLLGRALRPKKRGRKPKPREDDGAELFNS